MREIYRDLILLRKEYAPLRKGRVLWLHNSKEESVVTYERTDENKDFVIVINFSNRPIHARVDVNNGEDFAPVRIAGTPAAPAADFPSVHMGGFEWRIYQRSSHLADRAAAGGGQLQVDAVPH
jgi:hypothetical protein